MVSRIISYGHRTHEHAVRHMMGVAIARARPILSETNPTAR